MTCTIHNLQGRINLGLFFVLLQNKVSKLWEQSPATTFSNDLSICITNQSKQFENHSVNAELHMPFPKPSQTKAKCMHPRPTSCSVFYCFKNQTLKAFSGRCTCTQHTAENTNTQCICHLNSNSAFIRGPKRPVRNIVFLSLQ